MVTQFEIDCALMAGRAYQTSRDPNGNNWFPVPSGWREFLHIPNNTSSSVAGFEMSAFQNTGQPNEIVISFAGTDPLTVDQFANLGLATGAGSEQLLQAVDYYLAITAANPSANITFTGHSLGGGIAALMGVFFGKVAVTFDQAPFANTAEQGLLGAASYALNLQAYLVGKTIADPVLSATRDSLVADLGTYLLLQDISGGIPNSDLVSTYRVSGEFTSSFPVGTLFDPIGAPAGFIQHGPTNISALTELHSQALLTAMLQSGDTPTSTPSDHTLGKVTFKLTDLLEMIFSSDLYSFPTALDKENFLERLVKHEAGVRDPVTGATILAADAMVTRFTSDMWKVAQDGGFTLTNKDIANTLVAFAMQFYYEGANATNSSKTLFADVTGGIRFDRTDVSASLSGAKGWQLYFQNYLAEELTLEEHRIVLQLLPAATDWFIQAGNVSMSATADVSKAFMVGGIGDDNEWGIAA